MTEDLLVLTSDIVGARVSRNELAAAHLPAPVL